MIWPFTLTTEVCRHFLKTGDYPAGLREQVAANLRRLEVDTDGLRRVHMSNVAGYSNVPVAAVR